MHRIHFIPHGGGPLPLMGDPAHVPLVEALTALRPGLQGAKAIIVVTAHWEAETPSFSSSAAPGMLYDYFGFPEETYRLNYPAPGAPDLAEAAAAALRVAGFTPALDPERGFDHGTFVPLMLMRPEADIPVLQMSLLSSLDPARHIAMGQALGPLLDDGVVLLGSGFSFHNMQALVGRLSPQQRAGGQQLASEFHDWLDSVICDPAADAAERTHRLTAWADAPGARFCQPREEHLLPLHVCFGAAQAAGLPAATRTFAEPLLGFEARGYGWG
ncbi:MULTISPECIES: class III extradiol ring-cleavage dioxygenase [unclassified Minwuia]|jgi:4,5-DOPA dioxygenase extradiol|uniref:DODA-type extradiol aromatic ring-opening family dioxygenase n=1 Tax=unclassified Minwuia TaxID=2618799 RepID=UPI0024786BFA|nr:MULTISPECIES: class III extradiol ring-cleavage dioxygenase [unclassified Minwuia]